MDKDFELPEFMTEWTEPQRAEYTFQLLTTLSPYTITRLIQRMQPLIARDLLCQLPYEIAVSVLSHLDRAGLIQASLVSRGWQRLCQEGTLWKGLFEKEGWEYDPGEMERALSVPRPIPIRRRQREGIDWKQLYEARWRIEQRWRLGRCFVQLFPPSTHLGRDLHVEGIYCSQFDKHKMVTGSRDQTIKVWDAQTAECLKTLRVHTGSVLCLQYDALHQVVSGSSDQTVVLSDLWTGERIRTMSGHQASVLGVRFVGTDRIVSCSKDEHVRVWDRASGQCLSVLRGHRAAVNAVQWHGQTLVSASGDRTLKMWDVDRGTLVRTLTGHLRGVACVEFDGERIVSGSSDHTIRIWDARTGQCLLVFMGHTELVRTLQFSRKLNRIVSGCYHGHLKIWNLETGQLERDLRQTSEGRIFNVKFDFSKIVCCSSLAKLIVYDYSYNVNTRFLK
ncbi:WD40-repeat-containing domain protein [Sporodiniella umbellata]|nr:WD40-repeat-containing domain protein [Sporodiniella umbellata]